MRHSSSSRSAPAIIITPESNKRKADVELFAPECRKSKFELATEDMEPLPLQKLELRVTRIICDGVMEVGLIVQYDSSEL